MHSFFNESSPFHGISERAENFLLINGTYRSLEPGECLYQAGQFLDGYYVIAEGAIHLKRKTGNHSQHILLRSTDEWLGYVHYFAGLPASANAIAHKRTKIFHISGALSERFFDRYPMFYQRMLKDITREYVDFAEHHLCEVSCDLQFRIARQLLMKAIKSSTHEISLTQADLAGVIGAPQEDVDTQLRVMEKLGLIQTRYSKIIIKNTDQINTMVFGAAGS
ncbi:Cyclic nucleotide-binding domain protein [Vibrio aerogenes CECT 7868]|uniref:Cyclic nucleotide-binding domain protein n=1 Tax=Vibrio aerogenes CECT 7868 TaxID=1216006 RepID=A0A1M6B5E3_9VIBR|nr:Crp/Fnr family transcriptional regulator [Vibrio aerogenes]SHI43962.1 Cyclic nucleotide-binding domain protein [Vibrio aerogenes CECT 7868]